MTAIPARVAGVEHVTLASPRPTATTLAAAALAGVDGVLAIGGAQAIASLAYGLDGEERCDSPQGFEGLRAVDFVCGPGNRFVTAAKRLVFGDVGIDMLAGPSELVVVADATTDPRLAAADLIAQAEHDPSARPLLVALDPRVAEAVDAELVRQLATLPTASVAIRALESTPAFIATDLDDACAICDRLAPEHLELHVRSPRDWLPRLRNYGTLFLGAAAAEVFGDYGAGPNHCLPTRGGARFDSGLSVLHFVRVATWLELDSASELAAATARFARLEGLEGHARAAEARLS